MRRRRAPSAVGRAPTGGRRVGSSRRRPAEAERFPPAPPRPGGARGRGTAEVRRALAYAYAWTPATAQRLRRVPRHRAGHQGHVGMARGGHEPGAVPFRVVHRVEGGRDLDPAPVAGARVDAAHLGGAAQATRLRQDFAQGRRGCRFGHPPGRPDLAQQAREYPPAVVARTLPGRPTELSANGVTELSLHFARFVESLYGGLSDGARQSRGAAPGVAARRSARSSAWPASTPERIDLATASSSATWGLVSE